MEKTNCPKKREVESSRDIQGVRFSHVFRILGDPRPLTALNPIQELPLFLRIYHLQCAPTTLRSFTPVAPLHHGRGSLPSASFLLIDKPPLSLASSFRIEMASPRCADRGLLKHRRDWLLARLQRSLQEGGCGDGFRG
jgi:hypothetical protein